jgi:hypothetical protein
MPDEIDLGVVGDEAADRDPVADHPVREAQVAQLPVRHRTMLTTGEVADSAIRVV